MVMNSLMSRSGNHPVQAGLVTIRLTDAITSQAQMVTPVGFQL